MATGSRSGPGRSLGPPLPGQTVAPPAALPTDRANFRLDQLAARQAEGGPNVAAGAIFADSRHLIGHFLKKSKSTMRATRRRRKKKEKRARTKPGETGAKEAPARTRPLGGQTETRATQIRGADTSVSVKFYLNCAPGAPVSRFISCRPAACPRFGPLFCAAPEVAGARPNRALLSI